MTAMTISAIHVSGQGNLVPNPSFEERNGCPQAYPDLDGVCIDWMSFRGTPDYFHDCSAVCGYENAWGYQHPHSGLAYAAFYTFQQTSSNLSEQVGVQLTSPLVIGEKYFISFYVSAGYEPQAVNIATNKLGALFTTYPYYHPFGFDPPPPPLPNAAHVFSNTIVSDTISWKKISGSFTADSSYQYLVIGKFFDDSQLDTLHFPYSVVPQCAAYYLDDVCVSTDSIYANTWTTVEEILNHSQNLILYPNPSSDFITVECDDEIEDIRLYHPLGQSVWHRDDIRDNRIVVNLRGLTKGIYYLRVKTEKATHLRRVFII